MKRIIVLAALAAIFATPAFAARSIKADVNGLVCSFCAAAIEKRLKAMRATKAVYVDLSKKIVAVELKDGQDISLEKIAEEIKDAGYDVVKIGRSDQSIEQIRAEKGR
jgi:periplasmic mercuric ion binding protein